MIEKLIKKKKNLKFFLANLNPKILNLLLKIRDVGKYLHASIRGDWEWMENRPPDELGVNVSDICNANCVFCVYQYYSPSGDFMDMETYEKALDQFVELGGKSIDFNPLIGEPLLDRHLFKRIRLANKKGLYTYMFTNGISLNESIIEKLLKSRINKINISFGGLNRGSYEKIFGVDKYPEALSGIKKLLSENQKKGEPIEVEIILYSVESPYKILKYKDFKELRSYLHPNQIDFHLGAMDNWGGLIKEELPGRLFIRDPPPLKKRPCLWTLTHPAVLHNGDFRLCECRFRGNPHDELVVGNIHNTPMKELWLGDEAKKVRRSFIEGNAPKVCEKCAMYMPA